jgi:hypothetical protein
MPTPADGFPGRVSLDALSPRRIGRRAIGCHKPSKPSKEAGERNDLNIMASMCEPEPRKAANVPKSRG